MFPTPASAKNDKNATSGHCQHKIRMTPAWRFANGDQLASECARMNSTPSLRVL